MESNHNRTARDNNGNKTFWPAVIFQIETSFHFLINVAPLPEIKWNQLIVVSVKP